VNDWCHLIVDMFIGPYIFKQPLSAANYLNFLGNELPLLEVPGGKAPHFRRKVTAYLNQSNRRIGRGAPMTCPTRTPDLTPTHFISCSLVDGQDWNSASNCECCCLNTRTPGSSAPGRKLLFQSNEAVPQNCSEYLGQLI
jgi:hypothetical protein